MAVHGPHTLGIGLVLIYNHGIRRSPSAGDRRSLFARVRPPVLTSPLAQVNAASVRSRSGRGAPLQSRQQRQPFGSADRPYPCEAEIVRRFSQAAEVRHALIKVFTAWRSSQLTASPQSAYLTRTQRQQINAQAWALASEDAQIAFPAAQ
jgi:hypothetical protein